MASTVPQSARALWFGAAASVGAGGLSNWSRDTDYDDRFLQGVSGDSRSTGGSTHTHTQSHTHTGASHDHNISGASMTDSYAITRRRDIFGANAAAVTHSHVNKRGSSKAITYQNNTDSTSAANGSPAYMRAIIIAPDDGLQEIPDDVCTLCDNSSVPTGFSQCNGAGGTPNLTDKFILGAEALGDGGGTGGGSHGHGNLSHSHQDNSHLHNSAVAGSSFGTTKAFASAIASAYRTSHHYTVMNSTTLSDVSSDNAAIDSTSYEPAYTKLFCIQNTSGSETIEDDIILPYTGTVASIPSGWILCDGTSGTQDLTASQIKITNTGGDIGNTGGSNTHTHESATPHGHTHASGHTHTGSNDYNFSADFTELGSPSVSLPSTIKKHNHTWTVSSVLSTINNNTFTTDSADGRYNYRECVFIKRIAVEAENIPFFGCNF